MTGPAITFCQPDWEALRQKIRDAGLWRYVSTTGEAAAIAMRDKTFEPLIGAHIAIIENAMMSDIVAPVIASAGGCRASDVDCPRRGA